MGGGWGGGGGGGRHKRSTRRGKKKVVMHTIVGSQTFSKDGGDWAGSKGKIRSWYKMRPVKRTGGNMT